MLVICRDCSNSMVTQEGPEFCPVCSGRRLVTAAEVVKLAPSPLVIFDRSGNPWRPRD